MPRKSEPLPPMDVLRAMFLLTEEGRLVNKISRTTRKAGTFADGNLRSGRRIVRLGTATYYAHRIVWAMTHDGIVPDFIDHANLDGLDNRSANLRECTHAQNMRNKRKYKNNTSGAKGVFLQRSGAWLSYVYVNNKRVDVGTFASFEAARMATELARAKFHGEFGRAA